MQHRYVCETDDLDERREARRLPILARGAPLIHRRARETYPNVAFSVASPIGSDFQGSLLNERESNSADMLMTRMFSYAVWHTSCEYIFRDVTSGDILFRQMVSDEAPVFHTKDHLSAWSDGLVAGVEQFGFGVVLLWGLTRAFPRMLIGDVLVDRFGINMVHVLPDRIDECSRELDLTVGGAVGFGIANPGGILHE